MDDGRTDLTYIYVLPLWLPTDITILARTTCLVIELNLEPIGGDTMVIPSCRCETDTGNEVGSFCIVVTVFPENGYAEPIGLLLLIDSSRA